MPSPVTAFCVCRGLPALLVTLGLLLIISFPVTGTSQINIVTKDSKFTGQLEVGEYDAYVLPSGDGRTLTYRVEPNLTFNAFDILVFNSKQYLDYLLTEADPGTEHANLEVWRQEDQIEDFKEGWVLVVDNTNITTDGARAQGALSYSIDLEFEDKSIFQRHRTILIGTGVLLALTLLALVILRHSSGNPDSVTTLGASLPGSPGEAMPPPPPPPPTPSPTQAHGPGAPPPPPPDDPWRAPGKSAPSRGTPPPPPPPPPLPSQRSPSSGTPPGAPPSRGPDTTLPPPPPPSHPPPPPSTSSQPRDRRMMLVECPGCSARIEYDPQASHGRITCTSCGLSGKVD